MFLSSDFETEAARRSDMAWSSMLASLRFRSFRVVTIVVADGSLFPSSRDHLEFSEGVRPMYELFLDA